MRGAYSSFGPLISLHFNGKDRVCPDPNVLFIWIDPLGYKWSNNWVNGRGGRELFDLGIDACFERHLLLIVK